MSTSHTGMSRKRRSCSSPSQASLSTVVGLAFRTLASFLNFCLRQILPVPFNSLHHKAALWLLKETIWLRLAPCHPPPPPIGEENSLLGQIRSLNSSGITCQDCVRQQGSLIVQGKHVIVKRVQWKWIQPDLGLNLSKTIYQWGGVQANCLILWSFSLLIWKWLLLKRGAR